MIIPTKRRATLGHTFPEYVQIHNGYVSYTDGITLLKRGIEMPADISEPVYILRDDWKPLQRLKGLALKSVTEGTATFTHQKGEICVPTHRLLDYPNIAAIQVPNKAEYTVTCSREALEHLLKQLKLEGEGVVSFRFLEGGRHIAIEGKKHILATIL
jgi:hypothetical protein